MSSEQSDHENLRPGEPLDDFEAALAALRPHVDRSQSKTEFNPLQNAGRSDSLTCKPPAGHQFVCLHCGSDAPRIGRARRFAWPAALATMTSIAAVLLVMLVADRSARVADRENKPSAPLAAAVAAKVKPAEIPDRAEIGGESDLPRRLALHPRGGRWILSAADIELRDDLLASHNGLKTDVPASFTDLDNADARLSNGALTRRLLSEYGGAGRTAE
jgi:hypothetical protein